MFEMCEDKHILRSVQDAVALLTQSSIGNLAQLIIFTCSPATE